MGTEGAWLAYARRAMSQLRALPPKRSGRKHRGAVAVPVVRFRMRVTVGEAIAIGPGKVALLEAVGRTGSITAAALSLGMSYRRAWLLLDEVNRSLQQPAVDSAKGGQRGGGSALTETGQQLIALYRRIEQRAASAARRDISQMLALLAT